MREIDFNPASNLKFDHQESSTEQCQCRKEIIAHEKSRNQLENKQLNKDEGNDEENDEVLCPQASIHGSSSCHRLSKD